MAITFVEQRKKQKYLIWIFVLFSLATLIVVWFGFFRKKPLLYLTPQITVISPRQVQINFELLESDALKSLEQFEGIPPLEGQKGRQNPFLPF